MLVNNIASIAAVAVLAEPVLGGSRSWEAPLQHVVNLDRRRFEAIPIDEAGFAIPGSMAASNISSHHKRWFGVNPGQGRTPTYLWPDKTISYCYDSADTRKAVHEGLEAAMNMWSVQLQDGSSGLNKLVYKYLEVADPGTACTDNSQRDKILVISHTTDGGLQTTNARPPLDAARPDYKGPVMKLSSRTDVGQLNILANWAHELGHAWGLYHEHQNPLFWQPPYGNQYDPSFAGDVFGKHWDCTALKDWPDVLGKIVHKYFDDPAKAKAVQEDVCSKQSAAADWGFSAADWLPIKANYRHTQGVPSMGASYINVDWKSIMLYPSGAGGYGTARPPNDPDESPDVYDQRQPVLLRNDGVKIHTNAIPSPLDVAGIKALYESGNAKNLEGSAFVLPNDQKSPDNDKFKKDFSKTKGDKCNKT